jgi:small conductance mechanosensitive channel
MLESVPAAEGAGVTLVIQEASELVDQVSIYSDLIMDSLFVIVGGMAAVFFLYRLTSKFLFPYVKYRRLVRVIFGTIYVLMLVVTSLLVLKKIGIDTSVLGKVSIVTVLLGAVAVFFLVPFLPRLPFIIGQMIEVGGVFGVVDNISTLHTTIRTFDGAMVFLPNPMVLASKIVNYSDIPQRRIGLKLTVNSDADIEEVRGLILAIADADERVLEDPAPPVVRATSASGTGVDLVAFCWTKNEDFLNAQSDLWIAVVQAINGHDHINMVLPQQEIHIVKDTDL